MNIQTLSTQNLSPSAPPRRQQDGGAIQAEAVQAAATPAPASLARTPPTVEQVHAAVEQIEKFLKSSGRALDFHVDNDTGQVVVSVRDAASGDLIRQIPSEEALRLARTLSEGAKSLVDAVA